MDFGKLANVDQVDFRLAPEPKDNAVCLASVARNEHPVLYIGPTGYNMKQWVGKWYPPGAQEKSFLKYYAEQFNTIEFNTTHYRIPDWAMVEKWAENVGADFRFCPKIPQSISHSRDLGLTTDEMTIFCRAIQRLGDKLGCCFMQLPPQFIPREANVLKRFLEIYAPQIPLAIEVRHPAFFEHSDASAAFFHMLRHLGAAAVITDVAGRRDVCHMRLTQGHTLIRFVGNGLHSSDYSRIQEWAVRLRQWFDQGLQAAYFFTHEPDNLLAPELSAFCYDTFSAAMPDVQMRGPKPVAGQQGSLF